MEAKIEKRSELSKLLSVKTRMSDDLFHSSFWQVWHRSPVISPVIEKTGWGLRFGIDPSLCLSRIVGESIHRLYKHFSYVPMFFLARRTCLSVILSSNCLFPQFRNIIPCEVLFYIEVTFWALSIDLGIFRSSWFLHRHKIPHPNQWGSMITTKKYSLFYEDFSVVGFICI